MYARRRLVRLVIHYTVADRWVWVAAAGFALLVYLSR
jgi:hypothetical protein